MPKILIVDDKQMMRDSVGTTLTRAGMQTIAAPDGNTALHMLARHRPAAVVTDLKMPEMDGIELLDRIVQIDPQMPVILMTAYATVETAVRALKQGAFDYIQKPFDGEDLVAGVRRAVEHYILVNENAALKREASKGGGTQSGASEAAGSGMIGGSSAMQQVRARISRIAGSHGTVLVTGESGTGKEVVARAIHENSPRRDRVMLAVNCAALNPQLLESELFGHEKGAFTGAESMRKGRFELAEGGTLLLDEISEISPELQAKLLRVLQERELERVGSSVTLRVDVRIIATTNRDLRAATAAGQFRQDLYYRLNVLPVPLPPLRERQEDIPGLAEHFLIEQATRDGREAKRFDDEAMAFLQDYHWPGNVRELQNVCERAGVLAGEERIPAHLIQPWLTSGGVGGAGEEVQHRAEQRDGKGEGGATLEQMEREMVIHALERYDGHRQRTAEALGMGVRTLGMKLKKWKERQLVAQGL